jgi:hypothetical protein
MSKIIPVTINNDNQILDYEKINGRVNLLEEPSTEILFKMQERVAIKNKTSEYREALNGVYEESELSNLYFSKANIQILQNGIRAGIYEKTNKEHIIPPQNIDNIKIIMRNIYIQYVENQNNITSEIERLNQLVLGYIIPQVHGSLVSYFKYIKDQSTLVIPLELPNQSDRDYKQLEMREFM